MNKSSAWPKIRKRNVRVKDTTYKYYSLDFGKVNGKRKFENYKTKQEAESAAEAARLRAKKFGRESLRLTADLLADAGAAWDMLGGTGMSFVDAAQAAKELTPAQRADALTGLKTLKGFATITTATEFYMKHHNPQGGTRKVLDVSKEYQAAAVQDGLRARSILDLGTRLSRFERDFGERAIGTITRHDVDTWRLSLRGEQGQELSGVSVRNYCRVVGGMFNYAVDKAYAPENPFSSKGRSRRGRTTAHDENLKSVRGSDMYCRQEVPGDSEGLRLFESARAQKLKHS